jgi:uncharacterized protein
VQTSPYFKISTQYKQRFGTRVQKIPVTIAETCPNRLGLKGMQTCIFCDEWGSAAYPEQRKLPLKEQIESKLDFLGKRYAADTFFVYFQAYTSSFLAVRRLRDHFETALSFPKVKGLIVGTRPDCVPPALVELCREYQERCFTSIELGVQTFSDPQLTFLRRGHDAATAVRCIRQIKETSTIDLGIHLIFGLPGETRDEIIQTARLVSSLPIDHVKLHNLHVLRNTPLETLYQEGCFTPLSLEVYAERVELFLQHLSPHIAIQRLAAVSSRWDELVAPEWTRHKMKSTQFIEDKMRAHEAYQGQFGPHPEFVIPPFSCTVP